MMVSRSSYERRANPGPNSARVMAGETQSPLDLGP